MLDETKVMTETQVAESATPAQVVSGDTMDVNQLATHMNQVNAEVEAKKEVLTEVTSVHKEEAKTGEEVKVTPEQMREIAINDYMGGMLTIGKDIHKLSNRGMKRLMIALLQLPHPDEPVKLVSEDEKKLYGIGQRVQVARMYLLMEAMKGEIKNNKVPVPVTETLSNNNEEKVNVESSPEQQPEQA